jgi:ubiquinone/menaquinone biosynthesis C-methylase UbiE
VDREPVGAGRATERVRRYYDKAARGYDGRLRLFDRVTLGDGRRALCAQAAGRTLELAVGTGANLPHYARAVELTGIDLSSQMLEIARRRACALGLKVDLRLGDAQDLDLADNQFDTVVATLLMSTVPDCGRVAAEAKRVLKPGGTLLLLDMTRSPIGPVRWLERILDPATSRVSHFSLLRDPLDYLEGIGFAIERCERSKWGVIEMLVARSN